MKLVSDRLYLRDIRQSDLDAVHEYAGSFEVVRHQEWGPNTVEQTEEFIAGCLEAGAMPDSRTLNLGVALDNDKLIGSYRATLSEDGADAEIGYSLHPEFWGKGYGTEAALRLIEYLKDERRVRRVFATSRPENTASIRIMQKLGMRQVDCYRKNVLIRGEWRDTLVFSMDLAMDLG
jgi:ribosomal-protein-alanine N-acetyltransferase